MKLNLMCPECEMENRRSTYTPVDIEDSRLFKVVCSEDHECYWFWGKQRFELLFEMGSISLLDGYYRDALFNFYASLENFYGFYSSLLALRRGLDLEQFDLSWRFVARQSERQLGIFLAMYLCEFQRAVNFGFNLESFSAIRNKVVHSGYLPSKAEAEAWGEHVFDFIADRALEVYDDNRSGLLAKLEQHERPKALRGLPEGKPCHVLAAA